MSGKIYTRVKERQADARYRVMLARARAELFPAEPAPSMAGIKRLLKAAFPGYPSLKGRT